MSCLAMPEMTLDTEGFSFIFPLPHLNNHNMTQFMIF